MSRAIATPFAVLAACLTLPSAASAQMVDIPIWSNGILGQSALRNTYDNYNRANGLDKGGRAKSSRPCSADALPVTERRRMEADYARRLRVDGKQSADLWVREQGMAFHRRLVAEGVCPGPGAKAP